MSAWILVRVRGHLRSSKEKSMFDDIAAYYHEKVVGDFDAYRKLSVDGKAGISRDLRASLVAAESLFHLREHLPAPKPTRAGIEELCPEYGLLGDVVNASKHKTILIGTPHGDPYVTDASQIIEVLDIVRYQDAEGFYTHVHKAVEVKLNDGLSVRMIHLLTDVINFWEAYLADRGVISTRRTFVHDDVLRPRTRQECIGTNFCLTIVRGVRFHLSMRLHEYNMLSGKGKTHRFQQRVQGMKEETPLSPREFFRHKVDVIDLE
jgi:hypothetical protein